MFLATKTEYSKLLTPVRHFFLILAFFTAAFCGFAIGLEPSQVLVVVNADEPKSVSIGSYYIRRRGLPDGNLAALRLGRGSCKVIEKDEYMEKVVIPLRRLLEKDQYSHIRCLLTTYKMPYKIIPSPIDYQTAATINEMEALAGSYGKILSDAVFELGLGAEKIPYNNPQTLIAEAKKQIAAAIEKIKNTDNGEHRQAYIEGFLAKSLPIYGVFILLQLADIEFDYIYQPAEDVLAKAVQSRIFTSNAAKEKWSKQKCLEEGYYERFADVYGVLELLELLLRSIESLKGIGVSSALDSELALVKNDNYDWYMWQPNPLQADINDDSVLLVSRIDAPSEGICRRIIDDSISAEKADIKGSVCIDARFEFGKAPEKYAAYDNSLYKTAELFRKRGYDVVLEQTEAIFRTSPPLSTAFYCGWYSLSSYVNTFKFEPGAVGYHISSLEAVDIRDIASRQWVVSMLTHGISATIGAVDEPYLTAFPLPAEFFSRLIAGDCIAVAFAKTNPYNSWQIMLIADPLYTPLPLKEN